MIQDHETNASILKVAVAWIAWALGSITLSQLVLTATLIYTLINLFVLVRDKFWRDGR